MRAMNMMMVTTMLAIKSMTAMIGTMNLMMREVSQ